MKFLADQDVYGVTTRWLRGKGYDVVAARGPWNTVNALRQSMAERDSDETSRIRFF